MVRIQRRAACVLIFLSLSFLVGLLFATACVPAGNPFAKPAKSEPVVWPQVVLFGDSLTELSFSAEGGWGAILADRLRRKSDVVARGFGGYNTSMGRAVMPAIFGALDVGRIRAVTILLGTNDANDPEKAWKCMHVPLDEYVENLTWMVEYLERQGVDRRNVILITPPKCNEDGFFPDSKDSFFDKSKDEVTRKYAEACVQVAQKLGCDYVDIYHLMETDFPDTWKSLLSDPLHFSAKGSQVLADAVWKLMETRVGHLPYLMPLQGCRA